MKDKLKSPVFWCSVVVLIAEALKLLGVYEVSNELLSTIQDIITVAFQVFASLNNPNSRLKF